MTDQLFDEIYTRLSKRHAELVLSNDILPETSFEDGFRFAVVEEIKFLESLLADIELVGK